MSVGIIVLFVKFVDTKNSILSKTGQFMSSTYYVQVRNVAFTYTSRTRAYSGNQEKQTFKIFCTTI